MRVRCEHRPKPFHSPVSIWVHRPPPRTYWINCPRDQFTPPMPKPALGKGYPIWVLEHRGREIYFASPQEIAHVVDMLGRRVMPRGIIPHSPLGLPNNHWMSRLHKSWTPWPVRQRIVKTLAPYAGTA